jgi:hypothetical protein
MTGYSYSEIQKMQAKAMERVREMKRSTDFATQSAQKEFDCIPEKRDVHDISATVSAKVTNMPPNFPKDNLYPSFKEFFKEAEEKSQQQEITKPVEKPKKISLENLFNEPDKALLLGLIMLLKSEGADESLIMALTYILS